MTGVNSRMKPVPNKLYMSLFKCFNDRAQFLAAAQICFPVIISAATYKIRKTWKFWIIFKILWVISFFDSLIDIHFLSKNKNSKFYLKNIVGRPRSPSNEPLEFGRTNFSDMWVQSIVRRKSSPFIKMGLLCHGNKKSTQ